MNITRIKPSNGELIKMENGGTGILPVIDESKVYQDPVTKKMTRKWVKVDAASTMVTIAGAGLALQFIGLLVTIFRKPNTEGKDNGKS